MDDNLVRDRAGGSTLSIRAMLNEPDGEFVRPSETEPQPQDKSAESDPLPKPGDPYKAHGRQSNKPEITLTLLLKDASYDGLCYADLERIRLVPATQAGVGPVLTMRFRGSVVIEVLISGRNLNMLHVYLTQHRIPWIRELPPQKDFKVDALAVISSIQYREVEV